MSRTFRCIQLGWVRSDFVTSDWKLSDVNQNFPQWGVWIHSLFPLRSWVSKLSCDFLSFHKPKFLPRIIYSTPGLLYYYWYCQYFYFSVIYFTSLCYFGLISLHFANLVWQLEPIHIYARFHVAYDWLLEVCMVVVLHLWSVYPLIYRR